MLALLAAAVMSAGAIRVNGDSLVRVSYAASLELSSYTLEVTVRLDHLATSDDSGKTLAIVSRGLAGGDPGNSVNYYLALNYWVPRDSGADLWVEYDSVGTPPTVNEANTSDFVGDWPASPVQPGRWYDVAYTLDGTTHAFKVYWRPRAYKGIAAAASYTKILDSSGAGATEPSTADIWFGSENGLLAGKQQIPGALVSLTEIRLSDSVLDLATLNSRTPCRLTPAQAAACVAYWPADDGPDSIPFAVRDASGHGHDGVWVGPPRWADGPSDLCVSGVQ